MMDCTTHLLFPRTVIRTNINRPLSSIELSVIDTLKQDTRQSNGNRITNNVNVLNSDLSAIKRFIDDGIAHYYNEIMRGEQSTKLYVTQSWVNFTNPGEHHHKHNHPNSILSGVFYINADNEKDKIHFYDDRYRQIRPDVVEWNIHNAMSWWFPVKTGDLVIFPSDMQHMVEETESSTTRISLAFNTFFHGIIGNCNDLTLVSC